MEYVASQIQRNLIYHKLYPLSISFFINTTIVSINLWNGTLLISLLLIQIQLLFLLIRDTHITFFNPPLIQIQLLFLLILQRYSNNSFILSYSNTTIVSINPPAPKRQAKFFAIQIQLLFLLIVFTKIPFRFHLLFKYNYCFY